MTDPVDDVARALDELSRARTRNIKIRANLTPPPLSREALAYVESMGADAAHLLADFRQAPVPQQQELARAWHENGIASAKAFEA